MSIIKLPKLTPRGKKGILHFRPSHKGNQFAWLNLGTSVKGDAKKREIRFMNLLNLEGPEAALCDLKGIDVPDPEGKKLSIARLIELYEDCNEDPLNMSKVQESSLTTLRE